MGKGSKKLTVEENFEKLEETIEKLENQEISLEDAFRLYTEGMEILKNCNEQLDHVEKQVLKLTEDGSLEEM